MDVSQGMFYKIVRLILISALVAGCENPEPNSLKFSNKTDDPACRDSAIENEYVIMYKSGQLKVVVAHSKQELIDKHITPEFDDIEVVDQNIQLSAPTVASIFTSASASETWGQEDISAQNAWDQGYMGQDITVAVIDSGVNVNHPSLKNQIALNSGELGVDSSGNDRRFNGIDDDSNGLIDDYQGYNFASLTPDNIENTGHGTHVAGIIASEHTSFGGESVLGVAPRAKILPIDFIDGDAGGTIVTASHSIDYVLTMRAQHNIKVVNASWGGPMCSTILENKIAELLSNEILFVAAAGNDNLNIDFSKQYPASYKLENIITVGSVSTFLGMSSFTNYGDESVDLFAPGEQIYSSIFNNQFAKMDGTSMATPFVSGAAAVLWSKDPQASVSDIKQALLMGGTHSQYYRSSSQSRLNISGSLNEL